MARNEGNIKVVTRSDGADDFSLGHAACEGLAFATSLQGSLLERTKTPSAPSGPEPMCRCPTMGIWNLSIVHLGYGGRIPHQARAPQWQNVCGPTMPRACGTVAESGSGRILIAHRVLKQCPRSVHQGEADRRHPQALSIGSNPTRSRCQTDPTSPRPHPQPPKWACHYYQ